MDLAGINTSSDLFLFRAIISMKEGEKSKPLGQLGTLRKLYSRRSWWNWAIKQNSVVYIA